MCALLRVSSVPELWATIPIDRGAASLLICRHVNLFSHG
jgi:hypothetical protein